MFWPRRFTIYVLGEVIQLFTMMLLGLTSFIMLGIVLHSLHSHGLGIEAFTRMLPYASVMSLSFSIPTSLLFAVCTVYGRMSADNEIIAIKSVGIHPTSVVTPTLIFAFLLSPVAVWTIDLAVSWGGPGIQRVVLHSVEQTVYATLGKNHSYRSEKMAIHVRDVEGRWLIKPTIIMYGLEATPLVISADRAKISLSAADECLLIELENPDSDRGTTFRFDGGNGTEQIKMPLSEAAQKRSVSFSASMIPLRDIGPKKRDLNKKMDEQQSRLLARCSLALASGRLGWLQDSGAENIRGFVVDGGNKMLRLKAEPWRRWAQGFSCFCFVILGIPVAIYWKSADYIITFGVCFLPILILYYPLFILGTDRAKNGDWHVSSPWLANGLFMVFGLWMLRKVYRE
jgi:lipopolysaccharide export system permease protein